MSSNAPDNVVWHRETVAAPAEDTLRALHDLTIPDGAYLAGGTGLALRFGHRRSVDLDFFVLEPFDEDQLLQRIRSLPGVVVVTRAPRTLHLTIQSTKVSFLGYAYPLLFPLASFLGVPVADPRDIACMKITAIAGRGARRDFVDLYIACTHFGLRELLELFARKYAGTSYNRLHILKSLTYFTDAEKDPMPHMLVPLDWRGVKRFFEQEAPQLK
ncbi:MAG: nucleotidyl transferase AbiEii/AbiGii toxin family protein [Bryobacteraceae bacterium]|jgi:hypothetical protein